MIDRCDCGDESCTRCHPRYGAGLEVPECAYCLGPVDSDPVMLPDNNEVYCCDSENCREDLKAETIMVDSARAMIKVLTGDVVEK